MKKISIIMGLAAVASGMASCSNDAEPVFQKPTEFVLNTPALAQQYFELTPDGSIVLTCSQPDYGFTASVTYGMEIALSEGGETYAVPVETPTSSIMRVKTSDVATGMCVLRGIKDEADWVELPPAPLYFRATAQLGSHGDSFIESNWVKLDQVKGYFAVPQPGFIYLVGTPEGWAGPDEGNADHYADWRLFENADEIGSKVYYGVFDMPGAPIFRFYTALTGWDEDSWGSQADDSPVDFKLQDAEPLTKDLVKGKGSFSFPEFAGGEMTITVNMNTKKVTFQAGNQM